MSERSIEVFKQLTIAEIKFDYFILGISIALFSYLSQNLTVLSNLGLNKDALILYTILLLFISIITGITRVYYCNYILRFNFRQLYYQETRGEISKALSESNRKINKNTGEIFDPISAKKTIHDINNKLPKIGKYLEKYQKIVKCCFYIRNWTLLASFFLILLSRILLVIK